MTGQGRRGLCEHARLRQTLAAARAVAPTGVFAPGIRLSEIVNVATELLDVHVANGRSEDPTVFEDRQISTQISSG